MGEEDFNIFQYTMEFVSKFKEIICLNNPEITGTVGLFLGQRYTVEIILLIMVITIISLFIYYILIVTIYLNKEKILKYISTEFIATVAEQSQDNKKKSKKNKVYSFFLAFGGYAHNLLLFFLKLQFLYIRISLIITPILILLLLIFACSASYFLIANSIPSEILVSDLNADIPTLIEARKNALSQLNKNN